MQNPCGAGAYASTYARARPHFFCVTEARKEFRKEQTRNNQQSAPRAKRKEKLTENQNNTVNPFLLYSPYKRKDTKDFSAVFGLFTSLLPHILPYTYRGQGKQRGRKGRTIRNQDTKNRRGCTQYLGYTLLDCV